jgi:hypothetical protein
VRHFEGKQLIFYDQRLAKDNYTRRQTDNVLVMLKLIIEQGPVEDETTSEIEYIVDTLAWQHPSLVAAAGHPVPEQTCFVYGTKCYIGAETQLRPDYYQPSSLKRTREI